MIVKLYTDGSCRDNGKEGSRGAYAYAIVADDNCVVSYVDTERDTTNNRMEMQAIIAGFKRLLVEGLTSDLIHDVEDIEIYSDSAYVVNCYNNKWYENWQKNNWQTSRKQPVLNRDLWVQLLPIFEMPNVSVKHVKGHNGDKWNEHVNELAQEASAGLTV